MLSNLSVTLSVVTRQSRQEGWTTADGASLTLPPRLSAFTVSMGGTPRADRGNTNRFLSLNGEEVRLNLGAAEGASAKIGVRNADGTWRTLTFTKQDNRRISVEVRLNDSLNPQK